MSFTCTMVLKNMCSDCPLLLLPIKKVCDFYLASFHILHLAGCNTHCSFTLLQIEITHRVAWRASSDGHYCNETTISSQNLLSLGWRYYLVCQSGCSGTVGNMSFYCTGFSTSEDWTTGGRTYTYNATGITSFEAS